MTSRRPHAARRLGDRRRAAADGLTHRRVAGVIVTPASGDHSYLAPSLPRLPAVFVDRPSGTRRTPPPVEVIVRGSGELPPPERTG